MLLFLPRTRNVGEQMRVTSGTNGGAIMQGKFNEASLLGIIKMKHILFPS